MKRLINCSMLIFLLLGMIPQTTATAQDTPLWEQLPNGTGDIGSKVDTQILADDFVLTEAKSISQIEIWNGIPGPVDIYFDIYANATDTGDYSIPGLSLYSDMVSSSGTAEEAAICSDLSCSYRHTINLVSPLDLTAGHYWLSVYGSSGSYFGWSYADIPTELPTYAFKYGITGTWDGSYSARALAFRLLEPQQTCPESIVVSNTNDSGEGSLRQAIVDVCPGGTITFAESLSGSTITLTSQLTLDKNVTIDGSALAEKVTIDANDTGRVFLVNSGVTSTLNSLRIKNGNTTGYPYGGGISNLGTLTVVNSSLESNNAQYGAGIMNYSGTLTVVNSHIASNTASSNGGGIYNVNLGVLTVTNTSLLQNTASAGGGISTENGSTTTVTGSTLAGNKSVGLSGGGGILNIGTMIVANSTLSGNSSAQGGGGIDNDGNLTLTNSTLSGNSAYSSAMGHGLYNYINGTLNYANTIIANSPLSLGDCENLGTIGTNTNNIVEDGSCSAGLSGDPMLNVLADNGGPTQTMALQAGSPAIDAGDDATCAAAPVNGVDQSGMTRPQGLHCDIGAFEYEESVAWGLVVNATDDVTDGVCSETHCSLREAVIAAASGDTITFAESLSGGMILITSQVTLDKNVTIDGSALAEKVTIDANDTGRVFSVPYGFSVTLNSLIITDGTAIDNGHGGGIYNEGTLSLINSSLVANTATVGGGIFNAGTLSITDSTLTQNNASQGGAVFNMGYASATLNGCTLSNNTSSHGGGIFNDTAGTLTVIDSTLSGNSATLMGGGIHTLDNSTTQVSGSTLVNNSAGGIGGAGILNTGTMSVVNSTFTGNTTGELVKGSAIYNYLSGTLTLYNSTLSGNTGYVTLVNDGVSASMSFANTIIANTTSGWDCSSYSGTLTESINNWVSDGETGENCGATLFGNPMLDPLADNGGPTQTMALLAGSPAIDAGDDTICSGTLVENVDQRGMTRPQGSACDIGAYELQQTVVDETPPVVTVPEDMTVPATSSSGAEVTFVATAYDEVDGILAPTCIPASGSTFPIAATTVTCTAIDTAGNIGSASFTVTVTGVPLNILPETLPPATVGFSYSQQLTAVGGTPSYTWSNIGLTGTTFSLYGDTGVLKSDVFPTTTSVIPFTAMWNDSAGVQFSKEFSLTVSPALTFTPATLPTGKVSEAYSQVITLSGGTGPYTFTSVSLPDWLSYVTDPTAGTITLSGTPTTFGSFSVDLQADDALGVKGAETFTLWITPQRAFTWSPELPYQGDEVKFTPSSELGNTSMSWYRGDACDITIAPYFGNVYIVFNESGIYQVCLKYWVDPIGDFVWDKQWVIVSADLEAPVIASHEDVNAEATSAAGAIVTYISPTTTDNIDGTGIANCTPASGTQFILGDTTVTCTAQDAAGNQATPTTFTVHVVDTPPQISVPNDITVPAMDASGAVVTFVVTAEDIVDGPITPICNPASGSEFPIGTTTVTCTATDLANNQGQASFTVTVQAQAVSRVSQFTPFEVSCSQFADGTAPDLSYLQYTVETRKKNQDLYLNEVIPSKFMYYLKTILPAEESTILITQNNDKAFPSLLPSVSLYDENFVALNKKSAKVDIDDGLIEIEVGKGKLDRIIYIAITFQTNSVLGMKVNDTPDVTFSFNAALNGNELIIGDTLKLILQQ